MFPLEKLTGLTAGPGNIPLTPKQQAADGKDYADEQNVFPEKLGIVYVVRSQR